MIIGQIQRNVEKEGIENSTKMQISASEEVQDHIIRLLTENGYKRPIPSLIREVFCNSHDGNIAANKSNEPVFVSLYKNETGSYVFEVSDKGIGMNEEEFYKYCMNIGESSKRNSNTMIGAMGAGFKSPLAYTDNFETIIRKNGKELKFLIYKGETRPECTKIYEKDTIEEDGVTVKVTVSRWDFNQFKEGIKEQLAHFPNAYIKIEGDNFDYSSAKVFTSELFEWSEIYPNSEMYISFGGVNYPIEYSSIKIPKINLPIAIKIGLEEKVCPIFNRESLIYTSETKELILEKIKKVATWFVNKYNESVPEEQELLKVFKDIDNDTKIVKLADKEFVINSLLQYSSVKPKELKIKGISVETPAYYYKKRNELLDEYETVVHLENTTWRTKHIKNRHSWIKILDGIKHIEVEKVPTGLVKKYLLEKHGNRNLIFLKKVHTRKLGNRNYNLKRDYDYMYLLNLSSNLDKNGRVDKSKFRPLIQEWQFVENQFKSLIINEINIENSKEYQEWLLKHKEEQKQNRAKGYSSGNYKILNKKEGDVTISYCVPKSVGSGFKFDKNTYKIQELHKNKYLTILFTEEEKEKALNLRNLQSKWRIAIVGKNEGKKIENIHNFITFKQFMEKSKPFKRLMTSFLFEKEVEKYDNIFERKDLEIIQNCLKPLYNDIQLLRSYVSKNGKYVKDNELLEQMVEVAKDYNLYDYEFWTEYQNVKNSLQKYEFITLLQSPSHWDEEETAKIKSLITQILFHQQNYRKLHENLEIIVKPKEAVVEKEETILEQEMEIV